MWKNKKKLINPKPKIKIKKISQSISHIDANNGIGFVAADIGIKQAIKNAKKTGNEKECNNEIFFH